ncbi:unnamed protein product [Lactuca saligna]|uniref:ABC transporter domain-containing protein n=1 Tax=Lactuca saligna TaxID=75948 RepID=A0AA36EAZ2_LACSI|nr:unnamed protein product [Lactuca saligna]
MSLASDLPFLGPRSGPSSMELKQLSRRPKHHISPTLGELLQFVGDANSSPNAGHGVSDPLHASPFVLSFNSLTYSVKVSRKTAVPNSQVGGKAEMSNTKVLLDDISGEAREGEIMAVLGASGSGKSTLIDALAKQDCERELERYGDVER